MPLSEAISHTEHLTILESSNSLQELLELFSVHRMHRVLILHQSDIVLLSQMDLIRFLQAFNHQLGSDMLDMPINEIQASAIKSKLNYKCTAAEAFLKLAADNTVSALPIVDDNDDLIGEISAQDLRGLNRNRWDSLLKPVVMFLKLSHGELYPPLTCHDRFTLSQVMSSFVLRKTHRLWWMDYQTTDLKGVITLTDILATFASYC
jgi:CBS-domain-containing membrane protein